MSTGRVSAVEIRRRLDKHARRQRLLRMNQGMEVVSDKVDIGIQTDHISDSDIIKFLKARIRKLDKEKKKYQKLVEDYLSD